MQLHKHWHIHTICDHNFLERQILLVLFSYGLLWYFRCFILVCVMQLLFKTLFLSKKDNKLGNWNPEDFEDSLPIGGLNCTPQLLNFGFGQQGAAVTFFSCCFSSLFTSVLCGPHWGKEQKYQSSLKERLPLPAALDAKSGQEITESGT